MRRTVVLLTLLLSGSLTAAAGADPLGEFGTRLVGSAASGSFAELPVPVEDASIGASSMSTTGRYVVFSTGGTGLVAGTHDEVTSVYVKDRETGAVELASRAADGTPNASDCFSPSLSDSGRRVVFACDGPLAADDTNDKPDVYLRDLDAGTTTVVSRNATGVGSQLSDEPAISGDGHWVAFRSAAGLTTGVTPGDPRIYRRDLDGTAIVLVDPAAASGDTPNGASSNPAISADGKRVVYETYATNLVAGVTDDNFLTDVYARNLATSTTTLVSSRTTDATRVGNGSADSPAISDLAALNRYYVAFATSATNGVQGDTDSDTDIARRDINTAGSPLLLASSDSSGTAVTGLSRAPTISANGDVVTFLSSAADLVAGLPAGAGAQGYRHAFTTGVTALVSRGDGATGAPGTDVVPPDVSPDGTVVALGATGLTPDADPTVRQVFARVGSQTTYVSRPAGTSTYLDLGGDAKLAGAKTLSADGRYGLFSSAAPGLLGTGPFVAQLWRRDNLTGSVVLVSRADGAAGTPSAGGVGVASISADGNRIAFLAQGDLGSGLGAESAVYVRDVAAATTVVASRNAAGAAVPAGGADISGNGNRVAFVAPKLFVRDLGAGTTVTVPDTPGHPESASLSADGGRLAWDTRVPDPNQGNYEVDGHAYVTDVGSPTATQLDTGAPDNQPPRTTSISDDGARVAFASSFRFVPADTNDFGDVYVVDVATGAKTLVSTSAAGGASNKGAFGAAISRDGQHVAFVSESTNLGEGDGSRLGFVRDLAAGRTRIVDRAAGAAGVLLPSDGSPVVDADGGCALFESRATGGRGDLDPDVDRVWVRAVAGSCPAQAAATVSPSPSSSPSPSPSPTPTTRARPKVSKFTAKPKRFHTRGKHRGTRFAWKLDQAAAVRIDVARLFTGHRKGKVCRPGKLKRKSRACTRAARVATVKLAGVEGANHVRFRRRGLKAGRYRATLAATSAGGTSKPVSVRLRARRR